MTKRKRETSYGDIGRVVTGVILIVFGLMVWGQNAADLSVTLTGGRGPANAGVLVVTFIVCGIGLLLIGLFWRGSERRR